MIPTNIFHVILKLYRNYQTKKEFLTPCEFIREQNFPDEDVIFHFINLQRHDKILDEICEEFRNYYKIIVKLNMAELKILFYILISVFDSSEENISRTISIILSSKSKQIHNILEYYSDEENQIKTATIACKYFDNDYVMKNFVAPIVRNVEYYVEISNVLREYEYRRLHKDLTVPVEMNVTRKSHKTPAPPTNTPAELASFRSNRIPRTTYEPNIKIRNNLKREYEKNRQRAQELLEEVKKVSDMKIKKPKKVQFEKIEPKPEKFKKIAIPKKVEVKKTLTMVMREALHFAKEEEACVSEINEILKGGVDIKLTEAFEKEMRELEEQNQLDEIERKRLKCLLSREEAIIARSKLLELKRKRRCEIQKEREKLSEELKTWKQKEKEKYERSIQSIHATNQNVKESEKKLIEEKQCNARIVQWETRQLLNKAMEEKERELTRKMQLIQEIKAMNQVKAINANNAKEFDKTETPNLGLLVEMSLAELEERLYIMKCKMQEEIDEKRKQIAIQKETKKRMIEDAKEFIEKNRSKARKKIDLRPVAVRTRKNPEIEELKRKLEKAKKITEIIERCPCQPCPVVLNYVGSK